PVPEISGCSSRTPDLADGADLVPTRATIKSRIRSGHAQVHHGGTQHALASTARKPSFARLLQGNGCGSTGPNPRRAADDPTRWSAGPEALLPIRVEPVSAAGLCGDCWRSCHGNRRGVLLLLQLRKCADSSRGPPIAGA